MGNNCLLGQAINLKLLRCVVLKIFLLSPNRVSWCGRMKSTLLRQKTVHHCSVQLLVQLLRHYSSLCPKMLFSLSLWWQLKQMRWFHVVKNKDILENRSFWVYSYGENDWLFKFKLSLLLRVKRGLYKIYLRLQMNRRTSHSLIVQVKDKIWVLRSDICTCGCEKC